MDTHEVLSLVLTALGFILAVLLAYLAFLQYRLERRRVSLDLFDRRWAVYKAAYDFISSLSQKPDQIEDHYVDYLKNTGQVVFLFDKTVEHYFIDVRNRALETNEAYRTWNESGDSSAQSSARTRYFELQRGFAGELDRLVAALEPFLSFKEFRKRP
jgi:hypothetical protein